MPLSPAEQEELSALRRMQELESKFASQAPYPSPAPTDDSVSGKLMDTPYLQKVKQGMDRAVSPDSIQDMAGSALLPGAGSALTVAKGLGWAGKMGVAAAQGAAMAGAPREGQPIEDQARNVALGATVHGVLGSIAPAIGGVAGALKKPARQAARFSKDQADAFVKSPQEINKLAGMLENSSDMPAVQDMASQSINDARKALKGHGMQQAKSLRELLTGKEVMVDNNLRGIHPDVDKLLPMETAASGWTQGTKVDANTANEIKRELQKLAKYPQGTVLDPVQSARIEKIGKAAGGVRSAVEQAGGEPVRALNKEMQESMLLQEALRRGGKNSPIATITSQSPDRMAQLARADKTAGSGLVEFGNKLGAAKVMQRSTEDDNLHNALIKAAGRGALRGADAVERTASKAEDPRSLQLLLNAIYTQDTKK